MRPILLASIALQLLWVPTPALAVTDQEILDLSIEGQYDRYPYRFIQATEATTLDKKPLVVFLHGLGQGGTDNTRQVTSHINDLVDHLLTSTYNAHLLAPQSPGSFSPPLLAELVDSVIAGNNTIDTNRIYVTGISAGGAGTYNLVNQRPGLFAAAVPLSAGQKTDQLANQAGTPTWIFTGDRDNTFKPITAQNMYTGLQSLGAAPRMTQIENTGHSGWSQIYADAPNSTGQFIGGAPDEAGNTGLYEWLFSQSRANPSPPEPRALQVGETILVDFGRISQDVENSAGNLTDNLVWLPGSPDDQGRYWNHPQNVLAVEGAATGTLVGVSQTTNGDKTTVGFRLLDDFNNASLTGITDQTTAPLAVVGDGLLVGSNTPSLNKAQSAEILIDGLVPGGVYDLELLAAVAGTDGGRRHVGWYWVNGELQVFDASDNTDQWLLFDEAIADAFGTIELFIQVSQEDESRSRRAYLNAVRLTAVSIPEPGSITLVAVSCGLALVRRPGRQCEC
ncbi:MAG: prolyl oligopeptidase family serine peptidase [Planctomycetota bacterium]